MDCLKVPEAGLLLQRPSSQDAPPPLQAFSLSLSRSVIDGLLQANRNGSSINLALGKTPTLQYGNKSHRIPRPDNSSPYELYLTRPYDSTRVATRLPNTTNLFTKPPQPKTKQKTTSSNKGADSGLDSDMEALQNGIAAREAAKERTQMIERAPKAGKSIKARSKLLSGYNAVPRSIATSPSHNQSPATPPAPSAAKQAVEKAKEQRVPLVHELATGEKSIDHLQQKWVGRPEDFKNTLEKMAEYNSDTKCWSMKKPYWKELDVWKYAYDSQEERQTAIDSAIRQYDKQRLSASEPEWQKLLKKEERGKGKCLSRLQASLAKGPAQPTPKIKVQKADDSSTTSKDDGDVSSDRSRVGGETMSRTNSTGSAAKPKKPVKEPEAKRAVPATKSKAVVPKTLSTKSKVAGVKTNGARVLSQAIIENSDSSGDEAPLAQSKPKPKPVPAVTKEPLARPAPKPAAKPIAKPAPAKRPHYDDDESSSSSGTPLSKRLKQKPPPQTGSRLKERVPAMQNPGRPAAKTTATRPKNTSPIKSSPLATSPPTNASDIESDHPPPARKRKAELDDRARAAKRPATVKVTPEVLDRATKFKEYYAKYEALHYQIEEMARPPQDKVDNLITMRVRLLEMKRDFYRNR
ncbi:hypothetical protein ISF_09404 [Cordyceps fumosorosea ARSEF 2679]|uniref:Uncharacterized protein n=1 Tax=Cordyceps fumosorosea (strain ARSEF 2679) TaxID=1081104 RepID=A0A167J1V8_CORFA|nr:hypothetical protein ISF_09404 [Cordyceps fumosorosea ARSEF 2679]OAA49701.1 hypothetical protein ISF_09404 [Cordyceps fumosorosea ARSEF 2679]